MDDAQFDIRLASAAVNHVNKAKTSLLIGLTILNGTFAGKVRNGIRIIEISGSSMVWKGRLKGHVMSWWDSVLGCKWPLVKWPETG